MSRSASRWPELRGPAADLFKRLAEETSDGAGITRECYAPGETRALEIFAEFAAQHGLVTAPDAAGNVVVRPADDDGAGPAHYIGSHADSVPQGGNYDGAAGVVAGLLCLLHLRDHPARVPVRALILRGEESAYYGRANIGSRALFGLLEARDLEAKRLGGQSTLAQAMEVSGVQLEEIRKGLPLTQTSTFLSYTELHIEQGPVMVARGLPIAVVSGIRGNYRHRNIRCHGEAGHSGTIPRWLRKDPVFALADLVTRLDEHWRILLERGLDLVVTIGVLGTNPADHAISRIPGEVSFAFEVRSQSRDTLDSYYELFRDECALVAGQRGVTFSFDDRVYAEPARMDDHVIAELSEASERLGFKPETLPSGAGHDAAVFANAGVPSGMLFVRNENGSHNPREAMSLDDFMSGLSILIAAIEART